MRVTLIQENGCIASSPTVKDACRLLGLRRDWQKSDSAYQEVILGKTEWRIDMRPVCEVCGRRFSAVESCCVSGRDSSC